MTGRPRALAVTAALCGAILASGYTMARVLPAPPPAVVHVVVDQPVDAPPSDIERILLGPLSDVDNP